MEHISNQIKQQLENLQIEKAPATMNLPAASQQSSILSAEQNKLLALKYKAPQIGMMTEDQLFVHSEVLLLKINVVTGWETPSGPRLDILIDQFIKKLRESYPQLNVEEIEYAFRSGGTTIEDWGKQMNLNLIDKVLIPYVNSRAEISKIEEDHLLPVPGQKLYTDEQLFDIHREDVENYYQRLRKGRHTPIPDYFGAILLRDKLLLDGETTELFFVRKLNAGVENIYIKVGK